MRGVIMSRAVKNKLVECVAINLSKQRCGDASRKDQYYIEAEMLLKQLFLDVLVERSKRDPQEYTECLENVQEIMDLDYYDVWFIESLVFGN